MNRFVRAAALAVLPLVAGACAPPGAIGPTVGFERQAARLLAEANAQDQDLIHRLLLAQLHSARTLLLGRIHREIISHGYINADGAAASHVLEGDLALQAPPSALAAEVRAGHMTLGEARLFLEDYALASRMSDRGETSRAMLARLGPVRRHDEMAAALERALAERADAIRRLFAELESAGTALDRYATPSPAPGSAARAAGASIAPLLIAAHVRDPQRRIEIGHALNELMESVLEPLSE